jgi:hypothetical protein
VLVLGRGRVRNRTGNAVCRGNFEPTVGQFWRAQQIKHAVEDDQAEDRIAAFGDGTIVHAKGCGAAVSRSPDAHGIHHQEPPCGMRSQQIVPSRLKGMAPLPRP